MKITELRALAGSWELAMRAGRSSGHTVNTYLRAVGQLLDHAERHGPDLDLADPGPFRAWLAAYEPAWTGKTAANKLASVRAFARFLKDEEGADVSGVMAVGWPKAEERVPPALTAGDVEAMISACPKTFTGTRDAAMISLMYDALLRSDETRNLRTDDVDLRARTVHVRLGKGRKERYAAFSAQTAMRLDRYLRARARHASAGLPWLWLAVGRGQLSGKSLYFAVMRRGRSAGIKAFPHMARAGGAIRWRRRGGSTEGLMTIGGWRNLKMVQLYTRAAETELALEESRRLHDQGLGLPARDGALRCSYGDRDHGRPPGAP